MIARDRLMHAMAAAFTDAELAAMSVACTHEQAHRAEVKARKERMTQPPIPREEPEETAQPAAEQRHASGVRVRAVGRRSRQQKTGTEG